MGLEVLVVLVVAGAEFVGDGVEFVGDGVVVDGAFGAGGTGTVVAVAGAEAPAGRVGVVATEAVGGAVAGVSDPADPPAPAEVEGAGVTGLLARAGGVGAGDEPAAGVEAVEAVEAAEGAEGAEVVEAAAVPRVATARTPEAVALIASVIAPATGSPPGAAPTPGSAGSEVLGVVMGEVMGDVMGGSGGRPGFCQTESAVCRPSEGNSAASIAATAPTDPSSAVPIRNAPLARGRRARRGRGVVPRTSRTAIAPLRRGRPRPDDTTTGRGSPADPATRRSGVGTSTRSGPCTLPVCDGGHLRAIGRWS